MRRIVVLVIFTAAGLAAAIPAAAGGGGCHGGFSSEATSEIALRLNCFGPSVARVEAGAEVTWTNVDDWQHNVHSQAFPGSRTLGWKDTHTVRFDDPGVYPFVCTIHPGMVGAVVVGDTADFTDATSSRSVLVTPADAPTKPAVKSVGAAKQEPAAPKADALAAAPVTPKAEARVAEPAPYGALAAAPLPAPATTGNADLSLLIGAVILAVGIVLGAGISRRAKGQDQAGRVTEV